MKKIKSFIKSFHKFISESNFIDVAIGLLIATAIKDLTTSFMQSMIMPILQKSASYFGLSQNLSDKISLFGIDFALVSFITSIFSFLATLFIAFIIIKIYARFKTNQEEEFTDTQIQTNVLKEILEELKKDKND